MTKIIDMGLNTEPNFKMEKAVDLRNQIHKAIEEDGWCYLSWDCEGRSRHQMHAEQWEYALPEYRFEIGYNYECKVFKRKSA